MNYKSGCFWMFTLTATLLCFGCNRAKLPDGCPPLQPCLVTVVMDGTPLPEAIVTLYPEESPSWSASGTTGPDGSAELQVLGKYKGAPTGPYRATVSKSDYVLDQKLYDRLQAQSPQTLDDPGRTAKIEATYKIKASIQVGLVAPSFGKKETTPLTGQVVRGKNKWTFEVTSSRP